MGVLRKTKSIGLLLSEFEQHSGAISTVELIKRLSSKINKTTIYRVLENLEEDGVLHSFLGIHGVKWYAKGSSHCIEGKIDFHPHFQCLICGKVDCVEVLVDIPAIPKRQVMVTQVLFQGKCEKCTS